MAEREDVQLVSVFEADDESTAELVRGLLEAEKIPAVIRRREPMLEAPLTDEPGIWGEIHVPENQAEKAREIIDIYLAGTPIESPEQQTSKEESDNASG